MQPFCCDTFSIIVFWWSDPVDYLLTEEDYVEDRVSTDDGL